MHAYAYAARSLISSHRSMCLTCSFGAFPGFPEPQPGAGPAAGPGIKVGPSLPHASKVPRITFVVATPRRADA